MLIWAHKCNKKGAVCKFSFISFVKNHILPDSFVTFYTGFSGRTPSQSKAGMKLSFAVSQMCIRDSACCLADIMVGQVSQLAPGISACPGDFFRRRYVSPGIQRSGGGYFLRPFRVAVLISCAYLISMCRIVLQIGVCKLRCVACSVDDAVYQKLVAGCALYCFPCQGVACLLYTSRCV